jgi:hypothetical protein
VGFSFGSVNYFNAKNTGDGSLRVWEGKASFGEQKEAKNFVDRAIQVAAPPA